MAFNTNDENSDDIVAEINMTPLIDVMLVLLIIFMVTSSVAVNSGLDIAFPQSAKKLKNISGDAIRIALDKNGILSIMGKKVGIKELEDILKIKLDENEEKVVLLEGDKDANLGITIQIMDMAKKHGAKRFAIAATAK